MLAADGQTSRADFEKEILRIKTLQKPASVHYDCSRLRNRAKHVIKDIESVHNNSWALFMYERNKASKALSKTAILYRNNKISYDELWSKTFDYCRALKHAGIKKGDEVPVCISNIPEYIYLTLACSLIGAVIHLMGAWFNKDYFKFIINGTKSKIMFVSEDKYVDIAAVVRQTNIETIILIALEDSLTKDENGDCINPYQEYEGTAHSFQSNINEYKGRETLRLLTQEEFLASGVDYCGIVLENVELDYISTITYTSGTTKAGMPKGVKHSNRAYICVSRLKSSDVSGMPEMKNLITMYNVPVYSHTNLSNVTDTLYCNCTYVAEPFNEIEFFLKSLLINKPNYVQSTLGHWIYLGKELLKKENKEIRIPSLMIPDVVGEACSPGEEKFLNYISRKHRFGTAKLPYPLAPVTFAVGGGTCESGGLFFTLFHALQEKKFSLFSRQYSLGLTPVKMAEVQCLNMEGDYCQVNEPGRLVVNSPASMLGYTDESLNDTAYITDKYGKRWINLGTMGYISDPKYRSIKMKSRADDYVFLSDGTFFPTFKVEEVISEDTKNIMSCTVIRTSDNKYVCHIEKQPTINKSIDEILRKSNDRVSQKLPKEVVERMYYRVHDNTEGFPIEKSGKRSLTILRKENDSELLYSCMEMLQ